MAAPGKFDCSGDEGTGYVHADERDLGQVQAAVHRLDEVVEGVSPLALGDMDDAIAFDIAEHGLVLVALLDGELVHRNYRHMPEAHVFLALVDIMLEYPSSGIIVHSRVFSHRRHRHLVGHGLDMQSESEPGLAQGSSTCLTP